MQITASEYHLLFETAAGLQFSIVSGPAVEFSRVSKSYSIYAAPGDRLKELATLNQRRFHTDYWALRDVTFEVAARRNVLHRRRKRLAAKAPSCRSARVFWSPPPGIAVVKGRVAALLELGSGFNPEFSGRDNVYLNGAILGFPPRKWTAASPKSKPSPRSAISSTSRSRPIRAAWSFASLSPSRFISIPEILLVDEALAVGDVYFRQRCMRKVHELARAWHHDSVRLPLHRRCESPRRPRHLAGSRPHHGHRKDRSRCDANILRRWAERTRSTWLMTRQSIINS